MAGMDLPEYLKGKTPDGANTVMKNDASDADIQDVEDENDSK
jgi:hypothetical protein